MSKNVAQQLVDELKKAGAKHFYAVAGDSLNAVNHVISNDKDLTWIHMRHEESGAFAAAAESFLNGFACCGGSSGPGHVHLINGLYDANHGGYPVLAIASTCDSTEMGTGYFQETNTIKLFDDCSCYNQVAANANQFARMLPGAIHAARSMGGVAVVALPGDVAREDASEAIEELSEVKPAAMHANREQLDALIKLIGESTNICLYCGVGCSGAHDEVMALSEKLKAPVAYSYKGKMEIEYDNEGAIGMTGLLGVPSAYVGMFECDLLIMLGTDFPYRSFLPNDVKTVQVDMRGEHIGRRTKVELGIQADVASFIAELLPMLEQRTETHFFDKCTTLYSKVKEDLKAVAAQKGTVGNIAPEYLTWLIDTKAAANTIFTVDTGMCCTWSARFITATKEREMIASYNHGSMCNALPMAIGAALARPEQPVIALCGDGGLSMMMGELMTVKQYNLPIKMVVYKNRTLGMVKLEMEVAGMLDTQTDLSDPDFAAVAKAVGIDAYSVTDPELLDEVLTEAFRVDGPVLVEVYTDPNALSMPPKISLSQMAGFSASMVQMLFKDRRKELIETIKSNLKMI